MKWTKVTVETTTAATDMLSYYLDEYGVEGIEVCDNIPLSEEEKKQMFIDILPELPEDDGSSHISCYIDDDKDIDDLCKYIKEKLEEMSSYMPVGTGNIEIGETEDKDWINNWKEFFHPIRVSDNIVIQPTWTEEMEVQDGDIVINIDPGVAFGTGAHETTRLCVDGLKKYIKDDKTSTVLDAGCGSGILSIAALKLGAKSVYGIDIDPLAVTASLDNLALNNLNENSYTIEKGDVIGDKDFAARMTTNGQYDIVVANILADVIIPLSAVVKSFMKDDGVFISSGIIDMKEEAVRTALLENGFEILETNRMGEWVSFVAKKK